MICWTSPLMVLLIILPNTMPLCLVSLNRQAKFSELKSNRACSSGHSHEIRIHKGTLSMSGSPDITSASHTDRSVSDRQARVSWMSPRGEKGELLRELLAGSVVALATIPTSVAYSTVIGLSPLSGIWSSAVVGLLVTIVGGGPGLIAGAAGVVAVPMASIVANYGTHYMAAAVILTAVFETIFGLLRLGKLANYVTEPVVAGFLNAFAMFLVKSQMKVFKVGGMWLTGNKMASSIYIAGLCAALVNMVPQLTSKVPASLAGLLISSAVAITLNLPIKSLADSAAASTFSGGLGSLPAFTGLPQVPLTSATLKIILATSLGVAMMSILETLLASRIACDTYRSRSPSGAYERDSPNRMIVGLGLGNAVSALFGGFGGCGLIPNTLLNGRSGGEGYASSFSYAISLCLAVVVFAPWIGMIPMAALAGLMLNVAANTFEWQEALHLVVAARGSLQGILDLVGMLVTTYLCFKVDMGLGVVAGVAITRAIDIYHYGRGFLKSKLTSKVNDSTEVKTNNSPVAQ